MFLDLEDDADDKQEAPEEPEPEVDDTPEPEVNPEAKNLLDTIEDIKNFLKRSGDLPAYISRENICNELAGLDILTEESGAPPGSKLDALTTSTTLLDVIMTKTDENTVKACVGILVAMSLEQLTSDDPEISGAAKNLIDQVLTSNIY